MKSTQQSENSMHSVTLSQLVEKCPEKIWPPPRKHGNGGADLQTSVKYPTPQATEARQGLNIRRPGKKGTQINLTTMVRTSFPTPTSSMMSVGDMEQAKFSGNGGKRPDYETVKYGTPKATQSVRSKEFREGRAPNIAEVAQNNGGQLNPDWEEWLMGWPVGWSKPSQPATRRPQAAIDWRELNIDPADYPGDILRITTEKENRCNRIKAIGNGQVPLCKAIALLTLAVAIKGYKLNQVNPV